MYYVMQTLISTKHQIVIPKEARKKLGLKPGQRMDVEVVNHRLVISKSKSKEWDLEYYRKKLGGLWKSQKDIDEYLEEQDRSWD